MHRVVKLSLSNIIITENKRLAFLPVYAVTGNLFKKILIQMMVVDISKIPQL